MFKRKNKVDSYGLLYNLCDYPIRAANYLEEHLLEYNYESLKEALLEMHEIEHTADLMLHDLNHKLARGYTRSLKKEDVKIIAYLIDEVTDNIEDILMRFYMFQIHELRSEALEFTKLISRNSVTQANILKEFKDFKTSLRVRESIVEIKNIEEKGDKLFISSVNRLFRESEDPQEIIAWNEIFNCFEKCCDSFQDVAQYVESVIIKNS